MGEGIASFVSYMDSACISLPSPFSKCIVASEKRCLLAGHQALLKGNHPMRQHQLNHYLISSKCSGRAGQKQQVEQRGTLSSAPIYLSLTPTNYCIYQATGTPLWPPILSYFSLSRNLCTTSAAPLYSTAISLLVPNSCPDHYLSLSSHL